MGRLLRNMGLVLLAVAVWLILASALGWLSEAMADPLARVAAMAGVACLGGGILAGLAGRMGRPILTRGRCVRCGARIERGQTYCLDHLLATVEQARDQVRNEIRERRITRV